MWGFGKTELAIRAAFKAVTDSKQVAVLVPTTILAFQHYNTFKSRLKNFPCNIEYVSRMRTAKELTDIKSGLKSGAIDIVIGTHKILGGTFEFKDLGLLIIDEEQKVRRGREGEIASAETFRGYIDIDGYSYSEDIAVFASGRARPFDHQHSPADRFRPRRRSFFSTRTKSGTSSRMTDRGGQIFFLHTKVQELPACMTSLQDRA